MPKDRSSINVVQLENAAFLPHVTALISEGHTITLPLRGRSMRPFLEDGRDKALLAAPSDIAMGDAVLAEIHPGHYVLHRIIGIDGEKVTLRGDGNLADEYCRLEDIRAKATGFYRKGRTKLDSTNGLKWRLYSVVWTRLYPIRRYLLFAFHPHITQRFKHLF